MVERVGDRANGTTALVRAAQAGWALCSVPTRAGYVAKLISLRGRVGKAGAQSSGRELHGRQRAARCRHFACDG